MKNIILILITIILVTTILYEIYFLFFMIKNKKLEKKYKNNIELQKKIREKNEIFWKNRNFRPF